ncbi:MAG: NAD(P)/FAD-dependent oxidoreductase [Firmicutes bacterium]|nr:NAD(P)/FAD-dependent oxidoreductase [Bacillota bacterium]
MKQKSAIIIGAGPAGLTAAYELLNKTDIKPIIFEMTGDIGGISKTVNYKGNRIDIGGHRFFSKSDRVMQWWQDILPLQGKPSRDDILLERAVPLSKDADAPDPEKTDKVMLIRSRLSRIFFLRKFFDYPVTLNLNTFANLGLVRVARIGLSYIKVRLMPIREERSLEDFFINRFGKELYLTFFKDYTEKVWGIPCSEINPEWGAQRIKGLSITKAVFHALKSIFSKDSSISQKDTETSLIGQFMYPKLGPGQMWEEVVRKIQGKGAEIYLNHQVVEIKPKDNKIAEVKVKDMATGKTKTIKGDYFFSTMPVRELVQAFTEGVPPRVSKIAKGLIYRDFITVGLLLKKLKIKNKTKHKTFNDIIPDNWIYIQERDVKIGRLQVFNNWSPYLVKNENTVWVGLEYFCNEGDELWSMTDKDFTEFAIGELAKIDIIEKSDVLDSMVLRMPKAYPAYFGTYGQFDTIRSFVDKFDNLFLIGRNGMHRYNNMDHSMLTAMVAVENIINGVTTKDNIWAVNAEKEYHEEKAKIVSEKSNIEGGADTSPHLVDISLEKLQAKR